MVEPKPDQSKRIISWEEYWRGIQNLKRQLEATSWYTPHAQFVGIPRGGVILNTLLMYHCNRQIQFWNLSLLSTLEKLMDTVPPVSTLVLVDDILDSGHTMSDGIDCAQKALPKSLHCQVKTVTMFKRYSCPVQSDISYRQLYGDFWVVFPYEE